jgi:ABC-2 type transport system permease protein
MRLSQAWIVARHDIELIRQRRSLLLSLVAFPLAVSIGFPFLLGYINGRAGPSGIPPSYLVTLAGSFSFWFIIGAASLPVAIASYSIVGEKVEKSLEPLLATPTTDGEILLGKALAAFLPTILAIWAGSAVFMGLMDRETKPLLGYLLYPNWEMAVLLLVLTPLATLLTIEVAILISARSTDVRSAQQASSLVFLPFILLYLLSEVGALTLNTPNLLYIGGVLALLTLGLFSVSRRTFHREEILTRWK